jgi:two-component system phosphate regulon sensor histidine kinase PhoR
MRKSIFFKTFWGFLLIIFIFLFLIVFYSVQTIQKWNKKNLSDQLHKIALALKPSALYYLSEKPEQTDAFVKKTGKSLGIRITIVAPNGKVLADSNADPSAMENHGDRPVIMKALKGIESQNFRFSSTLRTRMLYLAIPLGNKGSIIAALRVSMFVQDVALLNNDIKNRIIYTALILLALSLIITFLISKKISNPIKKIVEASKKVAGGDYSVSVFSKDKGELGDLVLSFNEMVKHQQELFSKISGNREELEIIIESIKEGLLVIDTDGSILITNRSFNQLIASEDTEKKKYWAVCRNTDLYNAIQKVIRGKKSFSGQIELGGKTYITSFNYLTTQRRIVITFHDISEIKRLETIKKEFVMNVSHELKTPLTSIKGFVETLEEEGNRSSRRYLAIIKRNTDRLIHIVQDLMLLSQVEDRTFVSEKTEIHLKDLLDSIVGLLEPMMKKKNLNFKLEVEKNLPAVKGDRFKLEDMFVNLLDNAIKYTEKGEISIRILREDSWIRCEIKDTGIGIPKKQLDRIFERFFVMDSSRSRETGGTGLGLSIVKHIVLMHRGTIEVESTINQGTTFTIRLPIS